MQGEKELEVVDYILEKSEFFAVGAGDDVRDFFLCRGLICFIPKCCFKVKNWMEGLDLRVHFDMHFPDLKECVRKVNICSHQTKLVMFKMVMFCYANQVHSVILILFFFLFSSK